MNSDIGWSTAGKHLVLTVTTGRTGTLYVRQLLGNLPGLCCLHEPAPNFVEAMRAAQTEPSAAEAFWLEKKLPFIRAQAGSIYFETSHLACKGFIEPLLSHGIVPDLVILERDKVKVATSLYMLGTIPARSGDGLAYLLSPEDPTVVGMDGWRDMHDWALCYWYCLEIDRRASLYARRVAELGGQVLTTSLDALKQPGAADRLLRFICRRHENIMPAGAMTPDRIDRVFNAREAKKRQDPDPNLTTAAMQEMAEHVRAVFIAASR
jgi:hypothetical protein